MHPRTKKIGAILALVAMAIFILPFCGWLYIRSANAARMAKTRALIEQNPQLQAAWDQALQDKVLTAPEAKAIEEQAGKPSMP